MITSMCCNKIDTLITMNCIHLEKQPTKMIYFNSIEEYLNYLLIYLDRIDINFSSSQRKKLFSFHRQGTAQNHYNLSKLNDYEKLKFLIDGLYDFISNDDYRNQIITCINASYHEEMDQKLIVDRCYHCLQDLIGSTAAA